MVNTTNTSYGFLSENVVDGGMLNEQGVMNVALSLFDLNRDIINDSKEKEVILFRQNLPLAKVFCASMSDWTFLTESEDYGKDEVCNDETVAKGEFIAQKGKKAGESFNDGGVLKIHVYTMYKNFAYAYRLPSTFLKMRYIDGDPRKGFAVKGDRLYCNELGCTVDYISTDFKNLPIDFGYLVAYKTAMELSHHLDPGGSSLERASILFNQTFSVLKQRDDRNFRLQNPAQNHYIDYDSVYWGYRK